MTRSDLVTPVEANAKDIARALADLEADVTRLRLPWQRIEVPEVGNSGIDDLDQAERTLRFMGLGIQADRVRAIRNAATQRISADIYDPQFGMSSGGGYRTGD